jgi:phosphoribosylformimino-5-aminoimidazole carboxamide ribotide isomerase
MKIIPAIDIKNGKCVRLIQGDPSRETIYCEDPVAQARVFASAGAKLIHVVDLDGAFAGLPINKEIVKNIAKEAGIPIEIGGGIRSDEIIDEYRDAGICRFIIGTAALEDINAFAITVEKYGNQIIAGVDAKSALVATRGWQKVSDISAIDFILDLVSIGVQEIIYTDIATDGMLKGPNIPAIREILEKIPGIRLIASGGVGSMEDIHRLNELASLGLDGCIVGKAIYDGRIQLTDAFSRI